MIRGYAKSEVVRAREDARAKMEAYAQSLDCTSGGIGQADVQQTPEMTHIFERATDLLSRISVRLDSIEAAVDRLVG